MRSGYWAPLQSELRAATARLNPPPLLPTRALRRSPFIESWFGLTVEPGGGRRIIFTWTPSPPRTPARGKAPARPDVVALKVTTPAGAVLFDGEVASARAGNTSTLRPDSAVFQATPGRLQFDLTILQADGSKLDVGALDFDVPNVRGVNPVILPPQLLSAGSAREFRDIEADANAAPLPGREFRRTERLLLRVPTFEPAGNAVQVSAKLVNRVGTVLIDLAPMPDEAGRTLIQFDLPLAPLRTRRVLDRSRCPQRRRHRTRVDPLPHHRLTIVVRHAPGPRAQSSVVAVRDPRRDLRLDRESRDPVHSDPRSSLAVRARRRCRLGAVAADLSASSWRTWRL